MQTLCLVAVCLFYAAVGGCTIYTLHRITIRTDDGAEVSPVVQTVTLPAGPVDLSAVYVQAYWFAWVAAGAGGAVTQPVVHPVVVITLDAGRAWLSITNDGAWTDQAVTNVFVCNAQGVPDMQWGASPDGVPVTVLRSDDLVTWTPLATVNVVNTASYTDVARDFYSGSAFYAVQ